MFFLKILFLLGVAYCQIYVNVSNGVDDVACGSQQTPCQSLFFAVEFQCNNQSICTIIVASGYYFQNETIFFNKPFIIQGEGEVMLNCQFPFQGPIFYFTDTDATVNNLTFRECTNRVLIMTGDNGKLFIDHSKFINNSAIPNIAENGGGAIFIRKSSVDIRNSIFIGNSVNSVKYQSGDVYGGAIYVDSLLSTNEQSFVNIYDSQFYENFILNHWGSANYGGAVSITTLFVDINNCTFVNNSINELQTIPDQSQIYGSALFITTVLSNSDRNDKILLESTKFIHNTITSTGGGSASGTVTFHSNNVTISDCLWSSNQITGGSQSFGAVGVFTNAPGALISAKYIQIYNSKFMDNMATAGHGSIAGSSLSGCLSLNSYGDRTDFQIINCTFTNNTSIGGNGSTTSGEGRAGALDLQLTSESSTKIINSTFYGNRARAGNINLSSGSSGTCHGGAIAAQLNNSVVLFDNCQFTNNSATSGVGGTATGGSVWLESFANITMTNCHFQNNTVVAEQNKMQGSFGTVSGGAVSGVSTISHSLFAIVSSSFNQNYVYGGDSGTVHTGCLGGAILLTSNHILIKDTQFQSNFAMAPGDTRGAVFISGGAVAITNTSSAPFPIEPTIVIIDSNFQNNSVSANKLGNQTLADDLLSLFTGLGGGVYVEYGELILSNTTGTSNIAIGSYSVGGFLYSKTNTFVYNGHFYDNKAGELNQTTHLLVDLYYSDGGAIYWATSHDKSNNFLISNCSLDNNLAGLGGAINLFNADDDTQMNVTLDNVVFYQNNALYGGALFFYGISSCKGISNVYGTNNTAAIGGGFIYFTKSHFCQCSAIISSNSSNEAIYGDNCASDPVALIHVTQFAINDFVNVVYPGEGFTISLALIDIYNNTVYQPIYQIVANASDLNFYSGNSKNIAEVNKEGYYTYSNAFIYAPVGNNITVNFTTEVSSVFLKKNLQTLMKSITFSIAPCPAGYELSANLNFCIQCISAYYNFGNGNNCTACPSSYSNEQLPHSCMNRYNNATNGLLSGNQEAFITQGYWPSPAFVNPTELLICPNTNSCLPITCTSLPTNNTQKNMFQWNNNCTKSCNNSDGTSCYCATGYTDRLCSRCICNEPGATDPACYYHAADFTCIECQQISISQLIILAVIVFISLLLFLMFHSKSIFGFFIQITILGLLAIFGVINYGVVVIALLILFLGFVTFRNLPPQLIKTLIFLLQTNSILIYPGTFPHWDSGSKNAILSLLCLSPDWLVYPVNSYVFLVSFVIFWCLVAILLVVLGRITRTCRKRFKSSCYKSLKQSLKQRFSSAPSVTTRLLNKSPGNPSQQLSPSQERIQHESDEENIQEEGDEEISVENEPELVSQTVSAVMSTNTLAATVGTVKQEKTATPKATTSQQAIRAVLFLLHILYFQICLLFLTLFEPCNNGYMANFPWIPCNLNDQTFLTLFILMFIGVGFMLGVPLLFFFVLFYYRKQIRAKDPIVSQKFGFLYEGFETRKGKYYFDIGWLFCRLILATAMAAIPEDNIFQPGLIVGTLLVFGIIILFVQPFALLSANRTVMIVTGCLLFNYTISLQLHYATSYTSLMRVFLFLLNTFLILALLALIIAPCTKSLVKKLREPNPDPFAPSRSCFARLKDNN